MEIGRESIICPGCGCLCDDLDVTSDGERLLEVANVCLWGVSRFLTTKKFHPKKERRRLQEPRLKVNGRFRAATYETALARAAESFVSRPPAAEPELPRSGNAAGDAREPDRHRFEQRVGRSLEPRRQREDVGLPRTGVVKGPRDDQVYAAHAAVEKRAELAQDPAVASKPAESVHVKGRAKVKEPVRKRSGKPSSVQRRAVEVPGAVDVGLEV